MKTLLRVCCIGPVCPSQDLTVSDSDRRVAQNVVIGASPKMCSPERVTGLWRRDRDKARDLNAGRLNAGRSNTRPVTRPCDSNRMLTQRAVRGPPRSVVSVLHARRSLPEASPGRLCRTRPAALARRGEEGNAKSSTHPPARGDRAAPPAPPGRRPRAPPH